MKLSKPLYVISLCVLAACGRLTLSLNGSTSQPVVEPEAHDVAIDAANFSVIYNGFGTVSYTSNLLEIAPQAPTAADETFSALVMIKETETTPVRNFELTLDMEVTQQTRTGSAVNPWETFSLFFGYNSQPGSTKTSNYFTSKPTVGGELGLTQGEAGQHFISTDSSATTPIASRAVFVFRREGNLFSVKRDGTLLYTFNDATSFPEKLYDGKGNLGFYVKDSKVEIHSVKYKALDYSLSFPSPVDPTLANISTVQQYSFAEEINFSRSASNLSSTGTLFWSCFVQNLLGDLSQVPKASCNTEGTFSKSTGILSWQPTPANIGTYYLGVEASQKDQGFAQSGSIVQIRPKWSANALFNFDAEFSLEKTYQSLNIPMARDLISVTENSFTGLWPSLVNNGTIDPTNLTEAQPWMLDADTNTRILHFDGAQNTNGLALTSANLNGISDIRVSYWFKRSNGNNAAIFAIPHTKGVLESRIWWGSGQVDTGYYTSTGGGTTSCWDYRLGTAEWVFITAQVISTPSPVLKTYINDIEVCSQALVEVPVFQSPIRVGAVSTEYSSTFAGSISEFAGYGVSTAADIRKDFRATADRYRKNRVYEDPEDTTLALHLDAANSMRGLYPPLGSDTLSWTDLGYKAHTKVFGDFTAPAGFDTTDPAKTAMVFNGLTGAGDSVSYMTVNADPIFASSADWTIEAWLKPGAARGLSSVITDPTDSDHYLYKTILEQTRYGIEANKLGAGYGLRIGYDNTVDGFIVNNYGYTPTIKGTTQMDANTWYHVAVSFKATSNGGELKSYLNGALEKTEVYDARFARDGTTVQSDGVFNRANDVEMMIGLPFHYDKTHTFNGRLAIVKLRNKVLTTAQIKANCERHKTRFGITCN